MKRYVHVRVRGILESRQSTSSVSEQLSLTPTHRKEDTCENMTHLLCTAVRRALRRSDNMSCVCFASPSFSLERFLIQAPVWNVEMVSSRA